MYEKNYIILLSLLLGCAAQHKPVEDDRNRLNHSVLQQQVRQAIANKAGLVRQPQVNEILQDRALAIRYMADYQAVSGIQEKRELLITIAGLDKINTVAFFIKELSNPEPEIRREAAIQLRQMTVNQAVQNALIQALDEKDDHVLIEVIEAVAQLNDRRVTDKLMKIAATHSDPLIREIARDYAGAASVEPKPDQ